MPEMKAKIGVVTVTYNSECVIDDFMESMLSQSHENFMLYIVDNASTDNTLKMLEKYCDTRIVVIKNNTNLGVAAGNNQGIEESICYGCDHVLLINNDTVFDELLIHKLLVGLSEYQCDIIVPKMMYYDNPDIIWFAGGYFNKWKLYINKHVGKDDLDQGQYDKVCDIEYAPTCCMLIKAAVFAHIGVMDEAYFVYFDDVDFCFKAAKDRLTMKMFPDAKLYHKVSSSTGGQYSDFSIKYGVRNRVYFLSKYFPKLKQMIIIYMLASVTKQYCLRYYTFRQYALAIKSVFEGYNMVATCY